MSKTIQEAVIGLASKVKGAAVTPTNATIASALDTLADALAGEDVQAKPTIAGAIDVITENYTPGGGGPELGAPGQCYYDSVEPTVGSEPDYSSVIHSVYLGEQFVASATAAEPSVYLVLAAGLEVETTHTTGGTVCTAYVCTLDEEFQYATIEPWDGTFTAHADGDNTYWTFTMPELNEGEYLVLWPH